MREIHYGTLYLIKEPMRSKKRVGFFVEKVAMRHGCSSDRTIKIDIVSSERSIDRNGNETQRTFA